VQFSEHYTEVLKVPVKFVNYPKDKIINKKGDKLDVRVKQSGFQIAWFKIFRPTIKVDLAPLPADSSHLEYNVRRYHKALLKDLPGDLNNAEFLNDVLLIPFAPKTVKKVPVVSQLRVQYGPGYASEQKVQITPDTIRISGAKSLVDTISEIKTIPLKKENVQGDIEGEVSLQKPSDELTLYEN